MQHFLICSSLQILGKIQKGVFLISGYLQCHIKENCHNSRIGDDIDMKIWPVTKFDKKNKNLSKKFDDHRFDVINAFPIYDLFEAIWKPDSGFIKVTFSIKATFCLATTENRTESSPTQLSKIWLLPEHADFLQTKCWRS